MRADSARKMLNRCASIHQAISYQVMFNRILLRSAVVEDDHLRERKEARLAAEIYAGSEDAWAELWERLKKPAWCYMARRLPAQDVEDLVSESLTSLCQAIKEGLYDPKKGTVRKYFYAIMRNLVNTYYRQKKYGVPEGDGDELQGEPPWKSPDLDPQDLQYAKWEWVGVAQSCLTSQEFKILILYFVDGYSLKEIPEQLGITYVAVRKAASRGYAILRKKLKEKGMLP
jgi:RNA polymerase sigma factor (sigma-70 family)